MFFRFQHSFGSLWIICFIPLAYSKAQLDSLQVQLRDYGQQHSEISDQVSELANAIAELYQQINLLRQAVNQTMHDVLRHFDSPPVIQPNIDLVDEDASHPS